VAIIKIARSQNLARSALNNHQSPHRFIITCNHLKFTAAKG
jgi:hypothetical protein